MLNRLEDIDKQGETIEVSGPDLIHCFSARALQIKELQIEIELLEIRFDNFLDSKERPINSDNFESVKREMAIIDWLAERGIQMKDAVQIIYLMQIMDCSLTTAIIDWRNQKEKKLEEHAKRVQPNCC